MSGEYGLQTVDQNMGVVTMSSIEIVDYINEFRKEKGGRKLRHDHFMTKVAHVLGKEHSDKFEGKGFYKNGTGCLVERRCYYFPEREKPT